VVHTETNIPPAPSKNTKAAEHHQPKPKTTEEHKIEFVWAASITDSKIATNFCNNKTLCSLFKTTGEPEIITQKVVGMKGDYSFKSKDGQWKMLAGKNGLQHAEEPTATNIALVRFECESVALLIGYSPSKLKRKSDAEYQFNSGLNVFQELSNVIKTARVKIAMQRHPKIDVLFEVPVAVRADGLSFAYRATEDYKKLIDRDPERAPTKEIKGFLEELTSEANKGNVFKCLAKNTSCSNFVWSAVVKSPRGSKTSLELKDVPHRKDIDQLLGKDAADWRKNDVDEPLVSFKEKYNDGISRIDDKLHKQNAADVDQNCDYVATDVLKNQKPLVHKLGPVLPEPEKPDKDRGKELQRRRFNERRAIVEKIDNDFFKKDIQGLKNKLQAWRAEVNQNVLKALQDRASRIEKDPEVEVVSVECLISNHVILNWSKADK
jgi:hypothetical protein